MTTRGHATPDPPHAGDQGLRERVGPVAVDGGEELHDLQVLPAAAVRLELGQAMRPDRDADRPILEERLVGDGGRDANRRFHGRFVAAPGLRGALEVGDRSTRRRSARDRTP